MAEYARGKNPNSHKHKKTGRMPTGDTSKRLHSVRVEDSDWEKFGAIAAALGMTRVALFEKICRLSKKDQAILKALLGL